MSARAGYRNPRARAGTLHTRQWLHPALGENRAIQILKLAESLAECNQLQACAQDRAVQPPALPQRHSLFTERFRIGRKSKESLLSEAAKEERFSRMAFEPSPGRSVVDVQFERQCEPEINVWKKHPLLPATLPLADPSIAAFRDAWSEPGERGSAAPWQAAQLAPPCRKQLLPLLLARSRPLPERSHHPELGPLLSCLNSRPHCVGSPDHIRGAEKLRNKDRLWQINGPFGLSASFIYVFHGNRRFPAAIGNVRRHLPIVVPHFQKADCIAKSQTTFGKCRPAFCKGRRQL